MNRRRTLMARLPKNAIGCEIGTWEGEFAFHLNTQLKPEKLFLIDPWKFEPQYPRRWYGGGIAKNQNEMTSRYNNVTNNFKDCPNIEIHRGTINTFVDNNIVGDQKIDWVYIDGNHSYEFVLNDLRSVYELMSPSGIISGDDLHSDEVRQAVFDFINENSNNIKNHEIVDRNQFIIYLETKTK